MKNKVLVLLLIFTIVCMLFAFVACKDPNNTPNGEIPSGVGSGDQNPPSGDNNLGGDNEQDGDDHPNIDDDSDEDDDFTGDSMDYSLLFKTDGNGKITGLSDYAIENKDEVLKLKIPKKIDKENINSIDISILSEFEFLRDITIYKNIEVIEGEPYISNLIVYRCELESKPNGWSDDFCLEYEDSFSNKVKPIIWNFRNNEVAEDGRIYYSAPNGMIYALKDGKAELFFSGVGDETELILEEDIVYKGVTYKLNAIGAVSFLALKAETRCHYPNLKSIKLPKSVTQIETCAFVDYDNLVSVSMPGVTYFGYQAFIFCSNLSNMQLSNNIEYIGEEAFRGCSNLTEFEVSNDLLYLGRNAFSECDKLDFNEFDNGIYLGNKENPYVVLIKAIDTNITNFEINTNTKFIYSSAFEGCGSLANIEIPSSVTSIGDSAFRNCYSLTSLEMPSSVTSIGNFAFWGCAALTSIEISANAKSIGVSAFYGCIVLSSIEIPNSVTSIGSNAFAGCSRLTNVTFGENSQLTSIGDATFYNCSKLANIEIPNGVTSIGNSAFYGCINLTSLEIPSSVTSIGYQAFFGCSGLTSVTFGKNTQLTEMGNYAFYGCSSLTSIVIPSSVINVGYSVFDGCSSLTIYCEAESKSSGWADAWNYSKCPVVWGYKG